MQGGSQKVLQTRYTIKPLKSDIPKTSSIQKLTTSENGTFIINFKIQAFHPKPGLLVLGMTTSIVWYSGPHALNLYTSLFQVGLVLCQFSPYFVPSMPLLCLTCKTWACDRHRFPKKFNFQKPATAMS